MASFRLPIVRKIGRTRSTGDAEAARRAKATPTFDLEDAQAPKALDAERIRLYCQAMPMKDIDEQECNRYLLQLRHWENTLLAINGSTFTESRCAQKGEQDSVRTHTEDGESVVDPSELLSFADRRKDRHLHRARLPTEHALFVVPTVSESGRSFFKRNFQREYEREWILSVNDLQPNVLYSLKS